MGSRNKGFVLPLADRKMIRLEVRVSRRQGGVQTFEVELCGHLAQGLALRVVGAAV